MRQRHSLLTQVNAAGGQEFQSWHMNDPATCRKMAIFWRDMAVLGESRLKDERLRLADWFERQAAAPEDEPAGTMTAAP